MYKPVFIKIAFNRNYTSKKKAEIEIKAAYIVIGKQFVRFTLRQKRISSTAVMLAENTLTIYKQNLYASLYSTSGYFSRVRLQDLPPRLSKPTSLWSPDKTIALLMTPVGQKLIKFAHYQKQNPDTIP